MWRDVEGIDPRDSYLWRSTENFLTPWTRRVEMLIYRTVWWAQRKNTGSGLPFCASNYHSVSVSSKNTSLCRTSIVWKECECNRTEFTAGTITPSGDSRHVFKEHCALPSCIANLRALNQSSNLGAQLSTGSPRTNLPMKINSPAPCLAPQWIGTYTVPYRYLCM